MNCFCISHHGAHKALTRNQKTWFPAFDEVIHITPVDDWTPGTIGLGTNAWRGLGEGFMLRWKYALKMLSREKVGCIMDYDIVFPPIRIPDDIVEDGEILYCAVFNDDGWGRFSVDTYGHCPGIATGETWRRILEQDGFTGHDNAASDRWTARCAAQAGIKFRRMENGYSRDGHWGNAEREMARQSGALVFHGVKSDADYITVTQTPAYRRACEAAKL